MVIDTFEQQLNMADLDNLDIYTVCDFNIHFSTVTGFQNTKWSNLTTDYNLTQLITHPTRVTKVSSSTIDHLYTNHSENILEIVSTNLSMSDNYPIAFTVDTVNTVNDKVKTITYRCFMTFQKQHFMNDLSKYVPVLDTLSIIEDQTIALETVYTVLDTTLDRHDPIKTERVNHVHKPTWLTDEIKLAIHKRDKLHNQGKMEEYKVLRNKINAMINNSNNNIFNNATQECKSTQHLWNNIKSVSNNFDKNFVIPNSISKDTHDVLNS